MGMGDQSWCWLLFFVEGQSVREVSTLKRNVRVVVNGMLEQKGIIALTIWISTLWNETSMSIRHAGYSGTERAVVLVGNDATSSTC